MPDSDESLDALRNSRDVSHQPRQIQGGTSGMTQTVLTAKGNAHRLSGLLGKPSLIARE
jgi:hypothetical protein